MATIFIRYPLEHGWRDAYQILAALTLIVIIPLALLLRRRLPNAAHQQASALASANSAKINLSTALSFITGNSWYFLLCSNVMPQVHMVSYCGLGYGPAVGIQMLSVMLLGGVVGRIVSGLIADRLGGINCSFGSLFAMYSAGNVSAV